MKNYQLDRALVAILLALVGMSVHVAPMVPNTADDICAAQNAWMCSMSFHAWLAEKNYYFHQQKEVCESSVLPGIRAVKVLARKFVLPDHPEPGKVLDMHLYVQVCDVRDHYSVVYGSDNSGVDWLGYMRDTISMVSPSDPYRGRDKGVRYDYVDDLAEVPGLQVLYERNQNLHDGQVCTRYNLQLIDDAGNDIFIPSARVLVVDEYGEYSRDMLPVCHAEYGCSIDVLTWFRGHSSDMTVTIEPARPEQDSDPADHERFEMELTTVSGSCKG